MNLTRLEMARESDYSLRSGLDLEYLLTYSAEVACDDFKIVAEEQPNPSMSDEIGRLKGGGTRTVVVGRKRRHTAAIKRWTSLVFSTLRQLQHNFTVLPNCESNRSDGRIHIHMACFATCQFSTASKCGIQLTLWDPLCALP